MSVEPDERSEPEPEVARLRRELAEAQAAVVTLRAALDASHAEVRTLYGSLSWRVTRPLRAAWDFASGLPAFAREMRGFPRRARYTLTSRGPAALLNDIRSELGTRLGRGSLAPAAAPSPALSRSALARRAAAAERRVLEMPRHEAPRASIVVPAFNEFASTYACLASLLEHAQGPSFEVIVSDDGSEDETREVEQLAPGVRVVRSDENRGFIAACNRGAAVARGDFLVFLNNDTEVTEGWLDELLAPFEDAEVGLVGGKLVFPDGRLQEAGGIIFSDGSGWNYGRGDDPSRPRYQFRSDADYCSGACLAIPRLLFVELGGFDADFEPMYYEDVALAFAVRERGRRVVFEPGCVVFHAEGATAGTDTSSGAKRFQEINRRTLAEKWGPALATHLPPESDPERARHRSAGLQVLVIDSYTPRPDRDAGSLRMAQILELLVRIGCRVSFLPENRAFDGDYSRALQKAGVEALYHPYLPSVEDHLRKEGHRYDVVIMSRVDVARQALEAVRRHCPQARRIFDTVDLHFLRETRRAEIGGDRRASRARSLREQELAVARACDATLVVSEAEQQLLTQEAPELCVELLSLIHRPEPTDTPFAERSGVVFIGSFLHPPNLDAVEYYLREVHPRVREELPELRFDVIGADPPRSLERLAAEQPGVRLRGHLPEIRDAFAAARVSVAPLRYGAGIKGKITSSLALGVPVVTTTVGAEGMAVVHGEHLMIADDPEAFARAVVAVHGEEALWTKLARNGLDGVASQFGSERAESALRGILGLSPA